MSRDLSSRRERRRNSLGGLLPDEVIQPTGVYEIQLMDDRGRKVLDKIKSNYITPVWANYAKWLQSIMPSFANNMVHNSQIQYGNNAWFGAGQPFAGRHLYPFWQRPFPWQDIILTDDTAPEDVNDHWLMGDSVGAIAWASMWKSANVPASGKRGQINEAECTVSGNGQVQKKVWDWSTTQGNGTYQTAGIGMIGQPNTIDNILVNVGPHAVMLPPLAELQAAIAAGPLGNSTNLTDLQDVTISNGKVFTSVGATSPSGTNGGISRTLVADVPGALSTTFADDSELVLDLSGLTWTDITDSFAGWTNTTSGSTTAKFYQWRREFCYVPADNDLLWTEIWGGTSAKFGRNDLATKASVWSRTWNIDTSRTSYPGTTYASICKIGSFIYIGIPSSNASGGPGGEVWRNQIYRFNYSDGLGLTTIPLPSGVYLIGGMVTDGTDLIAATSRGIARITVAGVITKVYGSPWDFLAAVGEQGLSPWESAVQTANQQLLKGRGFGGLNPFGSNNNANSMMRSIERTTAQAIYAKPTPWAGANEANSVDNENSRHLRYWNNRLWIQQRGAYEGGTNRNLLAGITGANCFSRALLDAPVTKTSSQTMKVSYELTLPDMDLWTCDHPAI